MLLKAETLKRMYQRERAAGLPEAKGIYERMEGMYAGIIELGYREMTDKMYQEWLFSIAKEKAKYANQKLVEVIWGGAKISLPGEDRF